MDALTDAGWLRSGPGEIRQTQAGGGALQQVSLLALEVYPAAHLATERRHIKERARVSESERDRKGVNALMQMSIISNHQI